MASKRRSEAIWIEAKGYWQVKVQKDGTRKGFTSSIKGRKGKHAAEAAADKWLENGTKDMRFPDAWAQYIAEQKKRTGKANIDKLDQYYRLYIAQTIGAVRLSSITPIMWQSCIDAAARKGLSARSCLNIRKSISAFVNYATRARWHIERLENGDLSIPSNAQAQKEKIVLQPDEIRELFSNSGYQSRGKQVDAYYIHAWRFLVATGLRRGELCGLRNDDVDGNILTIRRAINSYNEFTQGKNKNALRTIELTRTALNVLNDQRNMLREMGIVSEWIFCDKHGEHPNPHRVYKQWVVYREQHGIRSNLHELRHTFISINKSDLPLELMKAVVGHSSSMNTFGVYGHEIEGDRHRAAQIIDGVFVQILDAE